MAELRLQISTQQAEQSSRDFQRILNDIKTAARELDTMSLNTLGGTISRLVGEAQRLQIAIASVGGSLNTGLNVNTGNLAGIPAQLNAITTSAQSTASSVMTVAEAFKRGFQLTPNQLAGELKRQAAEAEAIQQQSLQKQVAAEKSYGDTVLQVRQSLLSALQGIRQQQVEAMQPWQQSLMPLLDQQITQLRNAQTAYQAFAFQATQPQQLQIAQTATSAPMAMPQFTQSTQDTATAFEALATAIERPQLLLAQFASATRAAVIPMEQFTQSTRQLAAAFEVLTRTSQIQLPQFSDSTLEMMRLQQLNPAIALPQFTQTTQDAHAAVPAPIDDQARQDAYMAQIRAQAAARPAAGQTFLASGTMYAQPQLPTSPAFADPT